MLGVVGRNWGSVYSKTLSQMGIPHWVKSHDWDKAADGIIIASPPETHFWIARECLASGIPVLIEKPVTLDAAQALELVSLGGIAFAGHTRLYSPAWRLYKESLPPVVSVDAVMGRAIRDPWMECGPHLAAMCFDLGLDPRDANIRTEGSYIPLSFVANGRHEFVDSKTSPTPIEVLLTEFVAAIERGEPDNAGLVLGAKVVEFLNEFR